ncbi:MAG: PD-(D/E)XK nuclease family protein [Gammaproteobacteria bacterium]|nr:PD-(D/E)XK nuclease family protein [Gammaproteobacteria bacterium]
MTTEASYLSALANGATGVVGSARLARAVRAHYAVAEHARGISVWPAPDLLPLEAWLSARFATTNVKPPGADLVLSANQERALWARCIDEQPRHDALTSVAGLARVAQEAWTLVHEWGVAPASVPLTPEYQAFAAWSTRFRAHCARLRVIDRARALASLRPVNGDSATDFALGFWAMSPALTRCLPPRAEREPQATFPLPRALSFPDRRDEIAAAVDWARATRERAPQARIALAYIDSSVPAALEREALRHGVGTNPRLWFENPVLRIEQRAPRPPLVDAALALLIAWREVPRAVAATLVTSPYLAGANHEHVARARAAAAILATGRDELPCATLAQIAEDAGCARLTAVFARLAALAVTAGRRASLKTWLAHFDEILLTAGWPGEEALCPSEQAAFDQWRQTFDATATLDLVLAPMTAGSALRTLREATERLALVSTAASDAVEVLPLADAASYAPDYVWVLGLHEGAWPAAVEVNPLLPYVSQRAAGVPGTQREFDTARAHSILMTLLGVAGEATISIATTVADIPQRPYRGLGLPQPAADTEPRDHTHRNGKAIPLDYVTDQPVPMTVGSRPRGGVAVLTDQAACPFRAFARHRLRVQAERMAELGIDARTHGEWLHRVLAELWRKLGSQAALIMLTAEHRNAAIETAIDAARAQAQASPVATALERSRLVALVGEWLAVDLARAPFTVLATEAERTLSLANLHFNLRVDRIDRLEAGGQLVIDYKTGRDVARSQWALPRPVQPQLLAYALTEPPSDAIAFAAVRTGNCELIVEPKARARGGAVIPAEAEARRARWRVELEALATAFSAGRAEVDPKDGAATCRQCDLQGLCRISEVNAAVALDEVPDA